MRFKGKPHKEKAFPKNEDQRQGRRPKKEKIKYRHSAYWLQEEEYFMRQQSA